MNQLSFYIQGIKTEKFTIYSDSFSNADLPNTSLNIKIDFKVNFEFKTLGTFFTIFLELEEKKLIELEVSCHFIIDSNSWNERLSDNGNKLKIELLALEHLGLITVGTTRGILFSKLENTVFSSIILPTINLKEMIKSDVEFQNLPIQK
jgi:hypothetical protein